MFLQRGGNEMLLESFFIAYLLDELNRSPDSKLPSIEFLIDVKSSTYLKIKVVQLSMFKSYCFEVKLASYGTGNPKTTYHELRSQKISSYKQYKKCFEELRDVMRKLNIPIAYEPIAIPYLCRLYTEWLPDESAELIQGNLIRIINLNQNRVNTYTIEKTAEKLFSHLRYFVQNAKKNIELDNAYCIIEHCFK